MFLKGFLEISSIALSRLGFSDQRSDPDLFSGSIIQLMKEGENGSTLQLALGSPFSLVQPNGFISTATDHRKWLPQPHNSPIGGRPR